MIKQLLVVGALAFAFPAQAAVTINYVPGASALPAGLTVIEDFSGYANGAELIGGTNAFAYVSSVANAAEPAFNSPGNFGAVLGLPQSGSFSIAFAPTSVFSFVLGSLDTYNQLTLNYAGGSFETFNGAQIALGATANGDQKIQESNGRVTYTVNGTDPLITSAVFRSINSNSFEFTQIAVAAVPEPATWLMMLLGFAGVGFSMRRKKHSVSRLQFA